MTRPFLSLFAIFLFFSWATPLQAQTCDDCRYLSPIFDSVMVTTHHFAEGVNINDDMQQLYLDVYQPYGDTLSARPVVIFSFGGGFVQGSKDDWYVKEVCNHFAKVGYVAVANDYRLGIDPLEILFLQHMRIFFRPMQDMRATIQYLKADFSELGNNFRIDTSKIFIGGASAGGITALMTAYCDKPEEMAEMGSLSALDPFGGFYATSGFYPSYSWDGLATINVSGAMINADWVEAGDIPIISAHGDADVVVPYGYGPLGGGLLDGIFDLQGSSIVHQRAEAVGVCNYLYTMEGQDHPNTGMGMDYIRAVVQRIAQRAYALINDRTFCCEMQVDATPGDTLFHQSTTPDYPLEAVLQNDNGQAELLWCSMPCGLAGNTSSVTATPDTTWETISLIAYEGECQAQNLHIVEYREGETSILENALVKEFSIFPSPTNGLITLRAALNAPMSGGMQLHFYDVQGRLVQSHALSGDSFMEQSLDITPLTEGTYLLSLTNGAEILAVSKVVVAR